MRSVILMVFSALFTTIVSATDYYISSSGSDSNSGTSSSSPWQTITKINSMFSSLKSGDRILFNRGDIFYGTIKITKSGSSGSPIVIGAYGTGDNPIITGSTTITGWTNEGGGIYSKIITSSMQTNMVSIDGVPVAMGRYPNAGTWLTYESHGSGTITDTGLGSSTNWTNAQVVIRKNDWRLERCLITSHSGNVISYSNLNSTDSYLVDGNGYFIQNDLRCLTDNGEWYHDANSGKFYMYFGSIDPTSKVVKVATSNNLIFFSNKASYITIENLSLEGSNQSIIAIDNGSCNNIIQNNSVAYGGDGGIEIRYSATNNLIDNNSVAYCNSCGITSNSSNTKITNNTVANIGLIGGSITGTTGNYSGISVYIDAGNILIQYNSVINTGYDGISFFGNNITVSNNFINYTGLVLDDCGGIYTQTDSYTGRVIDGNIVLNAVGNNSGTTHPTWKIPEGIYLDAHSANIKVTNNTVAYCNDGAIKLHMAHDNTVTGNTTFDSKLGLNFYDSQGGNIRKNTINNNICFALSATEFALSIESGANDISSFGTADYNYYVRPISDNTTIYTKDPTNGAKSRTLSGWQSFTNQDANSNKSPIAITNVNDVRFEYNASKTEETIALDLPMIDIKGTKYANSVTLAPFSSVILMPDPDPGQIVVPVYTGSVVENATPQIITMTYQTSLSNIIPANNAFSVSVNGANRSVSSVSVSGKTVQLTLSSAIIYGDIVSLSYTQPSSNPLQSPSGGLAQTISAQTVINNVSAVALTYVNSVIANTTPSILSITYNISLANVVPSTSAFTVMVNSVSRSVNAVAISGTNVLLTLATPVIYGDIITVSYTKPSSSPLQSTAGSQAISISSKSVTNNVNQVSLAYVSAVIQNATPGLLTMTYNSSLANIVPDVSAFTVRVNSVRRTVNSVAISDKNVLLTMASNVVYGDVITISYTMPSSNPLQSTSGSKASSVSSQTVTNNVSPINLTYVSSLIANASPSILTMTYNLTLANTTPAVSAFTVLVNSVSRTVSSVGISGTNVQLTLTTPVVYGDIVTVSYTKPASNPLQSSSGSQAASITAQSVTNNVNAVNIAYVSSVIANSSPSLLNMTFNLSLANTLPDISVFSVMVNSVRINVNLVSISGSNVILTLASPVVYGDVITVAYTKPVNNPLQATGGSQVSSFSAQTVTNNVNQPNLTYASSVIEDATPALLTMTFNLNLANIVPALSAFRVRVNSVTRAVSSVVISGKNVLLTLSSPVVYGDIVTISYTVPTSNPLQSSSGSKASSISSQAVINNVEAVDLNYLSSVISNATPTMLTMTYNLSLANIVPDASAFTVNVNSVIRTINSVAISGTNVILTLTTPVVYGDLVTVSYTVPANNPLQSSSGSLAESISAQTVINAVNPVSLTYLSSVIANSTPALLTITFNLNLSNIVPSSSAFTVTVNSVNRAVSSVAISGSNVLLTLASQVVYGDVVTVAYTKPSNNPLQSSSGSQGSSFSAQTVTNNVNTIIPKYVSSVITNATPSILTMTYDLSLANIVPSTSAFTVLVNSLNRTVNSIVISGTNILLTLASPVINGDIVTISYTKPSVNPLQSTTGGLASNINSQTVTNNVNPVNLTYISSSISNSAPSLLTMTYNLNLANIVPAASSFTVMVNSVNRAVSSVAVSGTNVILTLAIPVVYGDVVTVAYTKPSINPLQSSGDGEASSISAKTVINNVSPINLTYVNSVITNADPSLLTITYNISLSNITPGTSAFTVTVNSVTRTISSISISGTNVLLTLASKVVYGDVITVAYTKPGINPLQSSSGSVASSMSAQTVVNNVNPVNLNYVGSFIANATPSLLTITYNLSLTNIVPAASAFTVKVNSIDRSVTSVAISGTNVLLTLTSPAVFGDIVTIAYTKPVNNPLQSSADGQAPSFSAQPVTNNVNPVNLTFVSAAIEDATPSTLTMTYNLSLANIRPAASAFRVIVNSVTRTVSSVAISGTSVFLTLSSPVVYGDVVTVSYTRPSRNRLQSSSGSQASSIGNQTVTNNVNPAALTFISSVISNATPALITMTYNLNLANTVPAASAFTVKVNSIIRTVDAVAINGSKVLLTIASPVFYEDIVTVDYTVPASNPLQSSTGSQASSLSSQTVTNNVNAANPYYISSIIENDSPSLLIMTFNLELADIVPAASAFKVIVNSVSRNVDLVTIADTDVILTLASPVLYGDVITVNYVKPVTNPLQSPEGGQASSTGTQAVINNVNPSSPYYVTSVIENAIPDLLIVKYSSDLANIVPDITAFKIQVNSQDRSANSVTIYNGIVQILLSSPVVYGDIVTITYSMPSSNPLQSIAGGLVSSSGTMVVTNNVNTNNPFYISSVIENDSPALLNITFNLSLINSVPIASAFAVQVNSSPTQVNSVTISGANVMLTLANPVVFDDIITVSYVKPASNPLQSYSGGQVPSFNSRPVTNDVNPVNQVILFYLSSAIENATPDLLTMKYSLNLDNISPDTSAFSVRVNSNIRAINKVAVNGTNVMLTLASPVTFGDTVTISYTKPIINTIQTTSGIQAKSISEQPVTNNVNFINTSPEVVINYDEETYSGFIGTIDASDSYDIDGDNLTFEWIVPDNLDVSSKVGSKIQFLAPMVQETETFEVYLNVSDGRSFQSQTVSINIAPYKPEFSASKIKNISVSDYSGNNNPENIIDNDIQTLWSSDGTDKWISLELEKPFDLSYFGISFQKGQRRSQYFDIYCSKDNFKWDPILIKASSCNFSGGYQIFDIPDGKSNLEYSYIKLVGQTNSEDSWNNFSELKIMGKLHTFEGQMLVYPNPANDVVNVSIGYPTSYSVEDILNSYPIIRIFDIAGMLVIEKKVDPGTKDFQIPINLKSGIYLIQMVSGGLILAVSKLIVVN